MLVVPAPGKPVVSAGDDVIVGVVNGSYDRKRRAELAAFLRARRAGVRPEQVGLAPGLRRRTPGLRREEVAQLAGVGVTWYTWLEQGRPINASTQVLDSVARVLQLGSAERWHLYRLAEVPGVPPAADEPNAVPADVLPVLDALEPNPACVYSGKYDLLACNEPYAALFPRLVHAEGHRRNALWQMLTLRPEDEPLCDWALIPHMVFLARANYARHVGEPAWEEWIERLSAVSAEFRALWATHQVAHAVPQVKTFGAAGLGPVQMRTSSFTLPATPDMRMVVYMPSTAADAETIEALRARATSISASWVS
jgi:transcriptional regulator with XRE-family HTH domain